MAVLSFPTPTIFRNLDTPTTDTDATTKLYVDQAVAGGAGFDATSVSSNIVPSANVLYSLGTPTKRWKDLYLASNTIYLGGFKIGGEANALVFRNQSNNIIGSFDSAYPSTFSNVSISDSSISNVILNGVLGSAYGGTGLTSLTAGGILYASTSSVFSFATGTNGSILTSTVGVPTFTDNITFDIDSDGGTY